MDRPQRQSKTIIYVMAAQAAIHEIVCKAILRSFALCISRPKRDFAGYVIEQIKPLGVHLLDQPHFPGALPFLYL
jgi:hypothetical protein